MMIALLILLGFIAVAAGMFGLGLGVPVRDTTFGAAVLVSSTVAIVGGFILMGLAIAVSELRKALQTAMRQRSPERAETERGPRASWPEPRIGASAAAGGAFGADVADVIPTRFDAPDAFNQAGAAARSRQPADDELTVAGKSRRQSMFLASGAGPQREGSGKEYPPTEELRRTEPAPSWERFDSIRPADFRKPDTAPEMAGEDEASDHAGAARTDTDEVKSPPLSPADGSSSIRPVRVLKSGMINDVGYTLFSDGSIETQTADGLLRFGSIDEFRRHLEKSAG